MEASWSDDEVVISDDSPICLTSKTFFDLKRKTVLAWTSENPRQKGSPTLVNFCQIVSLVTCVIGSITVCSMYQ